MNLENTKNERLRWPLLWPCVMVFILGFCIMAVELVAGRMVSKQLGSSIYTWTSVIGVILLGITLGNYSGGRIADRFRTASSLPALFVLASAGCVAALITANLIMLCPWLWQFNWSLRVFLHVLFVFLLPSALLGLISPVVAKAALEQGLATGRTIGSIYAWHTAGYIAGTFASGYFLIVAVGTQALIWIVASVMLILALLYGYRRWFVPAWAVVFIVVVLIGNSSSPRLSGLAAKAGLNRTIDPSIIYEDETQYCYIAVKSFGGNPERRIFVQDTLVHSEILMGDISKLQYSYESIMAAVTHRFAKGKDKPAFLILGGGGYVLPRYLEHHWSGGRVDVAEIDPGVTLAAQRAFGLDPASKINTISLDARNYIDQVCNQADAGKEAVKYDFVYEDALNDYCVPYQLTTYEFNRKLSQMLTNDGIYMIELIDRPDSVFFLGAFMKTLKETFPFVSAISEANPGSASRNTYIVVAAKKQLELADCCKDYGMGSGTIWYFTAEDVNSTIARSSNIILTDDYAPVENLLAPVALTSAAEGYAAIAELKARKLAEQAEKLAWAGDLPGTLAKIEELSRTESSSTVRAYVVMARIFEGTNKIEDALKIYETADKKNFDQPELKNDIADLHYEWGLLLQKTGKFPEGASQLQITANTCREILAKDPNSAHPNALLGDILARSGDMANASEYLQKALELEPDNIDNHFNLIRSLAAQGLVDKAIEKAKLSIQYFTDTGRKEDTDKIQDYLRNLEQRKTKQ